MQDWRTLNMRVLFFKREATMPLFYNFYTSQRFVVFFLKRNVPLACFLLLVLFSQQAAAQGSTQAPKKDVQSSLPIEEIRLFSQAFERIRASYVGQVDDKTLLEYAISGMLSSLDPHSAYLKAEALSELQHNTQGHFGGLGVEIEVKNGRLRVIAPIDGTPAAKAGILAGDVIIAIDDHPIVDNSLSDAIEKMRGKVGTKIKLEIQRKDVAKPLSFELVRAEIPLLSVRSKALDSHIGYIRISQFQENTSKEVATSLKKLQKKHKLQGLILDLRNNPGGLLSAAIEVVDGFIAGGRIVQTKGRTTNSNSLYYAKKTTLVGHIPMVILINGGSASAAEIVAGALQDHKRAVILGTQSFGKGSVQTILPLNEDKAIKLTTARYFTPKGRSIQAQGITPDIYVEQSTVTPFANKYYKESDLPGHLSNPNGKQPEQTTKLADNLLKKDFQLYEAYTLLRGMSIWQDKAKVRKTP